MKLPIAIMTIPSGADQDLRSALSQSAKKTKNPAIIRRIPTILCGNFGRMIRGSSIPPSYPGGRGEGEREGVRQTAIAICPFGPL